MPAAGKFVGRDPRDLFQPLNANVIKFDDEPAYSLMARLARRQGVPSLYAFSTDVDLPCTPVARGDSNRELAILANASVDQLDRATFRREGNFFRLGKEILHFRDFAWIGGLRVCPDCLREDVKSCTGDIAFRAHVKTWWNVRPIRVCPFHRVEMLECIPGSTKPLDSRALDVRRAAGPDLDLMDIQSGPTVSDVRPERYMVGRLGFMPRFPVEILDAMPLWCAIRLMEHVGQTVLAKGRHDNQNRNHVASRESLVSGFDVLVDGDNGLRDFLDRLIDSDRRERTIVQGYYGGLYTWLIRNTDSVYDAVREVIREHMLAHFPFTPEEEIFGRSVGERGSYSIEQIRKMTGKASATIERYLVLHQLISKDHGLPRNRIAVGPEAVKKLPELLNNSLSFNAAQAYLDVSRTVMLSLLNAGLLPQFAAPSSRTEKHIFEKHDLDALLARLTGDAPACLRPPKDAYPVVRAGAKVRAAATGRAVSIGDTSTEALVDAMLAGKIRCVARNLKSKGFSQILVELEDVRAFAEQTLEDSKRSLDRSELTIDSGDETQKYRVGSVFG